MMEGKNRDRKLEISTKLLQMGKSLVEEGREIKDDDIQQLGGILVLASGLLHKSDDMMMFNYLCSMFTSKQILDDMMDSPMGAMMRASSMSRLDGIEDILNSMRENPDEDGDEPSE